MMNSCYKCGGFNADYEWTSICKYCRAEIQLKTLSSDVDKAFLDRLTATDITFLTEHNILCEEDMIKAACTHPR